MHIFVTLTDKIIQVSGDSWQNASIRGNGLNLRILQILRQLQNFTALSSSSEFFNSLGKY